MPTPPTTKAGAETYLSSVDWKSVLEEVVNAAVTDGATDPRAFIAQYFSKKGDAGPTKGQSLAQNAKCTLQHQSLLDIYSQASNTRNTGIRNRFPRRRIHDPAAQQK